MQVPGEVNPDKRQLPEALQSLELAPLRSSPRAIWYEAGLAAGRRQANWWRAVAAVVMLAAALAVGWDHRPANVGPMAQTHQIVPATTAVAALDDHSISTESAGYARLRDALLQRGLDALSSNEAGGDRETLSPTGWYPTNERGS